MLSDFHLHSSYSADSETDPVSQIERAISLGMREICFTDHHDYDSANPENPFILDFSACLPHISQLSKKYQDRIRVNIGVELGLQIHEKKELDHVVRSHSFDFIIGSSHLIDGQDPYYPEFFDGRSEKEAYRRYFQVTLDRVRTLDCFDVFGHLDYIVRYGPSKNILDPYNDYQDYIDPILITLIEKGKGLECNTGGFQYGLGHPNPTETILKRYRELGGEILTVGSDAHKPESLGYEFQKLPSLLKSCGFHYYTVFHNRKPVFIPL